MDGRHGRFTAALLVVLSLAGEALAEPPAAPATGTGAEDLPEVRARAVSTGDAGSTTDAAESKEAPPATAPAPGADEPAPTAHGGDAADRASDHGRRRRGGTMAGRAERSAATPCASGSA